MSSLPFELVLALRYLRPKRTFVSAITLISIIGVTLGVAVLIIVIAVMSGFDKEWHDRILGFNAHMRITPSRGPMEAYALVQNELMKHPQVKGVAPYIAGKVLIKTQPAIGKGDIDGPVLRGIDPEAEATVSILARSIIDGAYDVSGSGLLIGVDLADALSLRVGDRVAIYSPASLGELEAGKGEVAVLPDDYVINGIFDVGFSDFNSMVVLTSLENAQQLYEMEDAVQAVVAVVDDPYRAAKVARELEAALGQSYRAMSWMEDRSLADIFNALVVEKNMIRFLLFFIVLVAAFGITSSQITFVVQKTREIGTLKALGATRWQITSIFLGQSGVVGAMGVAMGLGLGLVALHWRNEFLAFMNNVMGFNLLPPSIYKLPALPALIQTHDILIICGGSLAICLLAGVIPAIIAGRLQPVEALRHE